MSSVEEKRQFERRPVRQTVYYSVTVLDFRERKRLSLQGEVIDISEKGVGIKTDYPLQPGHVITFEGEMDSMGGVVEWCRKENDNGYRAGIRFVEAPPSFPPGAGSRNFRKENQL